MTTRVAPETVAIPASHLDLLTRPICGVLTTIGGHGQPQSSLVWADWDGACAQVNTTLEWSCPAFVDTVVRRRVLLVGAAARS